MAKPMHHNNTAKQRTVIAAETLRAADDAPASITVAEYLESDHTPWMWGKAAATIRKRRWAIDRHIIPHLGDRDVFELTRREVLDWHKQITREVSAYTARAALSTLQLAFRHIVIEFDRSTPQGWVNPAELPTAYKAKMPPPNAGRVQYMTEREASLFIWSPDLALARRLLYAMLAYTGMRVGEASALTWADYDASKEPLGEFRVSKTFGRTLSPQTKTGAEKLIPVHPRLAELLAEWRATGWREAFGRKPQPNDILIPRLVKGKIRYMGANAARERWLVDRRKLGFDPLRTTMHGWRGAFMSWAEAGGVRREIIKRLTHTGRTDVVDGYITKAWPQLCEVVMAIDLPMPDEERPTYDIHGYDADGFNAEGVDRQGYDREGFNAEGYDRQGYDRQGFNRAGLDRIGLHLGVQGCLFGDLEPTTKPQTTTPQEAKEKTK